MNEGSLVVSLDRIETALARLEAAARTCTATAPAHSHTHTVDTDAAQDLERRHAALKASVEHTLTRLDSLIAEQT